MTRRGRIVNRPQLAWLHTQPCVVHRNFSCSRRLTVHHVKQCPGAQKDDTRGVPLCAEMHLHDFGMESIERLGRRKWEARFGIDLESEIRRLNELWQDAKKLAA